MEAADTNRTELVFIVDRSGSMEGLESDTVGGFNSVLQKQQKEAGDCRITTVLFDDEYELLHDRLELGAVSPLTEREYFVRGYTALLDAVGKTIGKIVNAQKHAAPEYRAGRVLFVIITDGMENASREYSYKAVKELVERQKSEYAWEFIFLGADMDAIAAAGDIGISRNRAQRYHNDSRGIGAVYDAVSCTIASYRKAPESACADCEAIPDDWGAGVEADFKSRNGTKVK